ncbi:methyltransferase domain-containing protein [Shewanella waksmanii]|uniref:methyltransferase domain-containing protein n=1 Tax=Shewanella waksmanii TaxID=213783 RepID=UPI003736247F
MQDKNFDALAHKFANNIYGSTKGQVRETVVWRDLQWALSQFPSDRPLRILDAGGGFGLFSQKLAKLGHQVVLCDISEKMLDIAKTQINQYQQQSGEHLAIEIVHGPIQALTVDAYGKFDLILCHAVAEWLADAQTTLSQLPKMLNQGGVFSLMFYNKEAMRFFNLVSGNFDYVKAGLKVKKKVGLTPTHPVYIQDVRQWLVNWNMSCVHESGVRVICDYLKTHQPANATFEQLLEMELRYSTSPTYVPLGRYVHFICQAN